MSKSEKEPEQIDLEDAIEKHVEPCNTQRKAKLREGARMDKAARERLQRIWERAQRS